MSKEKQNSLSDKEKNKLLMILEEQGRNKWFNRWKEHMGLPNSLNLLSNDRDEKEKAIRYLLLRVLINQQARFEKVREMSIKYQKNLQIFFYSNHTRFLNQNCLKFSKMWQVRRALSYIGLEYWVG